MDTLPKTFLTDAINWLLECYNDEEDQELIRELSQEEALHIVRRDFDGGLEAFLAAAS